MAVNQGSPRLSPFAFRLSPFDFRLSTFDFRLSTFDFRSHPNPLQSRSYDRTPHSARPRDAGRDRSGRVCVPRAVAAGALDASARRLAPRRPDGGWQHHARHGRALHRPRLLLRELRRSCRALHLLGVRHGDRSRQAGGPRAGAEAQRGDAGGTAGGRAPTSRCSPPSSPAFRPSRRNSRTWRRAAASS